MLEINEKVEKNEWNEFIIDNKGNFLQSFEWGEFQDALGEKVLRFTISENNLIIAQAQIIEQVFPFFGKSFFYIPFGPIFRKDIRYKERRRIFDFLAKHIKQISSKVVFLKVEPICFLFEKKDFNNSLKRIQPQKTLILSLEQDEEAILNNFAKKIRYNVKLSKRKGVKIRFQDEYTPEFYNLIRKTTQRDRFYAFGEEHYRELFDFNSEDFKVRLCLADYKGKVIGAGILVIFGGQGQCIHSASDWAYRSLKAPNLLQWERIKFFKDNKCKQYNFWGIDEKKWPGLTAFKKGFGGKEFIYPQGKDIVFEKIWYWIYKILRSFKKIIFK
jgi:lipid II:glycine glycyltransferase (peptidoglycan interpeptide bridge formation enzyme)